MKSIIDLKSNSVNPSTALQLAAYTLLDGAVEFDDGRHIYRDELGFVLPSVTGILKSEGFIDTTYYTEHGRDRGSGVHLACHYDDIDDLDEDTLDPQISPYLAAYRRFKSETGFMVEKSEQPMRSTIHGFAGTPDKIGTFPQGNIQRAAVELHRGGTYKLIEYKNRNDLKIFLSALAVYQWKQNNLRR